MTSAVGVAGRRALTAAAVASAIVVAAPLPVASAARYLPGRVIVGYRAASQSEIHAFAARAARDTGLPLTTAVDAPAPQERIVRLPRGVSVAAAVARIRRQRGVAYAVPDYVAHTAGSWVPDDPGRSGRAQGWQAMQWNFLPGAGVNAPEAWGNLLAAHHPGGRGVTVAILDTGIAYRNWRAFRQSPDFRGTRFVRPYDFVARNSYPLDRDGHGTFVAGIVAEATNNRYGLTGLAYGASIMPVRILGADGTGDAATISRGIRYAATHGANIVNLSLEFSLDVSPSDIPDIISAIHFAHRRGVVVVAAAGNEGVQQLAYPARVSDVISVGATTADRCLADYSNDGSDLDLVAPGGDADSSLLSDSNCQYTRRLPDISQMTFSDPAHPDRFGFPRGWYGTSMSAPHVAAAAALVIASGVIGAHPSPEAVLARLEQTAQPLGGSKPNAYYGYGLLDAGAATAPAPVSAARTRT